MLPRGRGSGVGARLTILNEVLWCRSNRRAHLTTIGWFGLQRISIFGLSIISLLYPGYNGCQSTLLVFHDCQRAPRKLSVHAAAFPLPPLPLPLRFLLVRASFANKENITARGWGLVPSFVRGARKFSWCPFKKHTSSTDNLSLLRQKK